MTKMNWKRIEWERKAARERRKKESTIDYDRIKTELRAETERRRHERIQRHDDND